jgi:hypothetical protein
MCLPQVDEADEFDPSLLARYRAASLVQQKALAAQTRRDAASEVEAPRTVTAWGQADRLEAMKERLLALERDKIAQMDPERLELMNLLADHGHNLDEDTVTALLSWKQRS